jgi:hypothetical protein
MALDSSGRYGEATSPGMYRLVQVNSALRFHPSVKKRIRCRALPMLAKDLSTV